jgi:hypothetical protein
MAFKSLARFAGGVVEPIVRVKVIVPVVVK